MVAMSDCIFSVLQFRKHTKTHRRTTSIYDGHRYIAKLHSRRITYCHCKTAYFSHSRPTHCHRCQILSHRIHLTVNPRHICWASSGASTNAPLTYGAHCACVCISSMLWCIFFYYDKMDLQHWQCRLCYRWIPKRMAIMFHIIINHYEIYDTIIRTCYADKWHRCRMFVSSPHAWHTDAVSLMNIPP